MGFLITGSDTRTPAHYHAVVTAVSVSSAGMLLTFGLEALGAAPAPALATRILIGLYGGGQFVASIGMFVAGGYGALRKTPSGAARSIPSPRPAWRCTASPRSSPSLAARPSSSWRSGRSPRPGRRRRLVPVRAAADGEGVQLDGDPRPDRPPASWRRRCAQLRPPGRGLDMVELHGLDPPSLSPFFDAAGNPVSLESFRGKVVILNLWAPWCVPCLQEMRSLDRLAARLQDKAFAVVAVSKDPVGDSPSKHMFDTMRLVAASNSISTRKARSRPMSARSAFRRPSSSAPTARRSPGARARRTGTATTWSPGSTGSRSGRGGGGRAGDFGSAQSVRGKRAVV